MKKVVEKQLEEENAVVADPADVTPEASAPEEAAAASDVIIKQEDAISSKPVEVPVFDWKEEKKACR